MSFFPFGLLLLLLFKPMVKDETKMIDKETHQRLFEKWSRMEGGMEV
jgi:hypothetical protein